MKEHPEDKFIKILTGCYRSMADMLPADRKIELDLGCGKGSFTTQLAKIYPERLFFAADVMIGRLRKLQKRNMRHNVENIIPLRVEARHLLGCMMPDEALCRLHILCPDPWPKDRHRANRLLCSDFMVHIHRVLSGDNGCFHFATDDECYFKAVTGLIKQSGLFAEDNSLIADVSSIKSDFEVRWNNQGKIVHHICWRKLKLEKPANYRGH